MQTQAHAVRVASLEGLQGAAVAVVASSTVVLGACKLFPRFNRSLSVSGKTALIVSRCAATYGCCWLPARCCLLPALWPRSRSPLTAPPHAAALSIGLASLCLILPACGTQDERI